MKILVVIDSLGSGGAQRQIVSLAVGLKERRHVVEVFVYLPRENFFRHELEQAGICIYDFYKKDGFSAMVVAELIRLNRVNRYDAVVSFLPSPNVYCELARIFGARFKLIVSERSSRASDKGYISSLIHRTLHAVADGVIANSRSHAEWLGRFPWLRRKTSVIYNGYPMGDLPDQPKNSRHPPFRYLVIGRLSPEKNGLRLIRALMLYYARHGLSPIVSWAGRFDKNKESQRLFENMSELLATNPAVAENWHWLGERNDIPEQLASHDALLHPSLYEGLPNVVCEAFIGGRPVLTSNVCDHAYLTGKAERGFLFDPLSPESILGAIEKFEVLDIGERTSMGLRGRRFAEEFLTKDRMVESFEAELFGG